MPLEIKDPTDAILKFEDEYLGTLKITLKDPSEYPYMNITKEEAKLIISHLQEQFNL